MMKTSKDRMGSLRKLIWEFFGSCTNVSAVHIKFINQSQCSFEIFYAFDLDALRCLTVLSHYLRVPYEIVGILSPPQMGTVPKIRPATNTCADQHGVGSEIRVLIKDKKEE